MAEPHIVIAVTKALPGHAAKLRALEEELVTATLKEPGCLRSADAAFGRKSISGDCTDRRRTTIDG
jgi:hypothetical protein